MPGPVSRDFAHRASHVGVTPIASRSVADGAGVMSVAIARRARSAVGERTAREESKRQQTGGDEQQRNQMAAMGRYLGKHLSPPGKCGTDRSILR